MVGEVDCRELGWGGVVWGREGWCGEGEGMGVWWGLGGVGIGWNGMG